MKLREAFEVWWPRLENQLESIPANSKGQMQQRDTSEVLEEILELVRNLSRGDRSLNLKPKSRPRLITTLAWSVEDGKLLTDHYYDALKEDYDDIFKETEGLETHLSLLKKDQQYALLTLKHLKRAKRPLAIPELVSDVLAEWGDDIPF